MTLSAILYLLSCVGLGHAIGVYAAKDEIERPLWAVIALIWLTAVILNFYALTQGGLG